MTNPKYISILDFTYDLPTDRIAMHPLAERDSSRLLVYKQGSITEGQYKQIDTHLPADSLLIFNNTKVIRARIRFQKSSGGIIEIFCLEPAETINEYSQVMNKQGSARWKCMIGAAGKWKSAFLEHNWSQGMLRARMIEKLSDAYAVEFSWEPAGLSFAEVLESCGDIPLPPYIKRKTEEEDENRYQTIYAADEGSVAAPTAGLHFTTGIFNRLAKKNIQSEFVTLHVGAGTFKPVKASTMQYHEMHAEWIDVSAEFITSLLNQQHKTMVAIGTTSLRTIESLYWMGAKAILNPGLTDLYISQWEVYETPLQDCEISVTASLTALLEWITINKKQRLFTQSQILIAPGYKFRIANAVVTNFHQPQSTLLLLVAAAVGDDWKKIYQYALEHGFRFLSYGDGSLLYL